MDIFISYRRGGPDEPDAPTAGRIHDYLKALGYQSFYDKDEDANPIGEQFPDTIDNVLQSCKVVIAVIGDSWRTQCARLANEKDWVRHELLRASPAEKRHLIPIHIMSLSQKVELALPPGLEFVGTATGFIWEGFEDAQKKSLCEKLEALLPNARSTAKIADNDRLELLCDRVSAADGFDDAINRREKDDKQPGCWILFGERGEGQQAILDRIEAYTLESEDYRVKYRSRQLYPLCLDEYYDYPEEDIRAKVIKSIPGVGEIASYEKLYDHLSSKESALCVLHSVVHVNTVDAAKWWIELFIGMRRQFPPMRVGGAEIVLALSISYVEPDRPVWRRLLGKRNEIGDFFRERYPHLFPLEAPPTRPAAQPAADKRGSPIVKRLRSVQETDVRDWCDNRHVKQRIERISRKEFIAQFKEQPQRPMEDVMETLQSTLQSKLRPPGRNDK